MSAAAVSASDLGRAWTVVLYAALVVLHLAVFGRRVATLPVFTICAAAELVVALAPTLHDSSRDAVYPAILLPSSVAYLVAAYTLSAWGRDRWPSVSLGVGLAGALVAVVRAWTSRTEPGVMVNGTSDLLALTGLASAFVVAAWALGRSRRLRTEQLAALAERARVADADRERREREVVAEERARIARELHDVIAHSVSVMVRQAEGGRYVAATDPAAASGALAAIAETGREALTDIRVMLGVLDPEHGPASLGPQPRVEDVTELVERVRASGQPVRMRVEGDAQPLDRAAHLAAYRLVQEALTNVVKHAGPHTEVEVVLTWGDRLLELTVADSGGGTPAGPHEGSGRGLLGMRERLELVGGTLQAGPAAGGFTVVGKVPTTAARDPGGRG